LEDICYYFKQETDLDRASANSKNKRKPGTGKLFRKKYTYIKLKLFQHKVNDMRG
jgi:hypothetical protein